MVQLRPLAQATADGYLALSFCKKEMTRNTPAVPDRRTDGAVRAVIEHGTRCLIAIG